MLVIQAVPELLSIFYPYEYFCVPSENVFISLVGKISKKLSLKN